MNIILHGIILVSVGIGMNVLLWQMFEFGLHGGLDTLIQICIILWIIAIGVVIYCDRMTMRISKRHLWTVWLEQMKE